MTNNTLSPIQDTQTQDDEIIRQRQSEACARVEEELTRTKIPPPAPRLVPPEKFALEDFALLVGSFSVNTMYRIISTACGY
ncbi:hypothetical protein QK183_001633 [Escherichia coli]|nr:hypothetical protein [Escherichia coli]ELX2173196.1 hypothetical protein [Escherichia coli]